MDIECVEGCEGNSVYFNNYRVAGNKPWGGGYCLAELKMKDEDVFNLIYTNGQMRLEFWDGELYVNGEPTQGRHDLKQLKRYIAYRSRYVTTHPSRTHRHHTSTAKIHSMWKIGRDNLCESMQVEFDEYVNGLKNKE